MTPWFIATQPFGPEDGERWLKYVEWSGLTQLEELVCLDGTLCRPILRETKNEYWPHIVNEDFMLDFFVDFDFSGALSAGAPVKVMRDDSAEVEVKRMMPGAAVKYELSAERSGFIVIVPPAGRALT